MAYSYYASTADGTTSAFGIPFEYLSTDHVHVSVDGTEISQDLLTFPSPTIVALPSAPAAGATVKRWRKTTATSPWAVFTAGVFDHNALNEGLLQLLYVAQEAFDDSAYSLEVAEATEPYAEAASASASSAAASASSASSSASAAAGSASSAGGLVSLYAGLKEKLDAIVYLDDFGAAGDGTTDDSSALSQALAALPTSGGIVRGGAGKRYLFADPPVIPRNVTLLGQTLVGKPRAGWDLPNLCPSVIVLPSSKTLSIDGGRLEGWLVWRQGLTVPTTEAEFYTLLAAYAGTAVTATGDDPYVVGNLFVGFALGVLASGVFRPEIAFNGFDCLSGIEATNIADCGNFGISYNRCWGYLNANRDWPWATARRAGPAIYVHDTADWLKVEGNFSYGHDVGLHLANVAGVRASHQADGIAYHDATNAAGTIGILTTGECNAVVLDGSHVDGQERSYVLTHTTGILQMGANTSGLCLDEQISLGAGAVGDLGDFTARGTCTNVIKATTGVGRWTGRVITDSYPSGGAVVSYTGSDLPMLRGIRVTVAGSGSDDLSGGSATAPTVYPHSAIASGLYLPDGSTMAAAVAGKEALKFTAATTAVNYPYTVASAAGIGVTLGADGSDTNVDINLVPKGSGAVVAAASIKPSADNVSSLGVSGDRWTAVWAANGTIQTSDPAQKTGIAAIDTGTALSILQMIDPITFRWRDGGSDLVEVEETVEIEATRTVTETVERIVVVDGIPTVTTETIEREEPITDLIGVVDATGAPVMVEVPAVVHSGEIVQPARTVQRMHPVPRKTTVTRTVLKAVAHEGRRVHWGWNARQVEAAFEALSLDFGGFVRADDGSLALRPDQLIPVLWAAVRGLAAGVVLPTPPEHPAYDVGAS